MISVILTLVFISIRIDPEVSAVTPIFVGSKDIPNIFEQRMNLSDDTLVVLAIRYATEKCTIEFDQASRETKEQLSHTFKLFDRVLRCKRASETKSFDIGRPSKQIVEVWNNMVQRNSDTSQ